MDVEKNVPEMESDHLQWLHRHVKGSDIICLDAQPLFIRTLLASSDRHVHARVSVDEASDYVDRLVHLLVQDKSTDQKRVAPVLNRLQLWASPIADLSFRSASIDTIVVNQLPFGNGLSSMVHTATNVLRPNGRIVASISAASLPTIIAFLHNIEHTFEIQRLDIHAHHVRLVAVKRNTIRKRITAAQWQQLFDTYVIEPFKNEYISRLQSIQHRLQNVRDDVFRWQHVHKKMRHKLKRIQGHVVWRVWQKSRRAIRRLKRQADVSAVDTLNNSRSVNTDQIGHEVAALTEEMSTWFEQWQTESKPSDSKTMPPVPEQDDDTVTLAAPSVVDQPTQLDFRRQEKVTYTGWQQFVEQCPLAESDEIMLVFSDGQPPDYGYPHRAMHLTMAMVNDDIPVLYVYPQKGRALPVYSGGYVCFVPLEIGASFMHKIIGADYGAKRKRCLITRADVHAVRWLSVLQLHGWLVLYDTQRDIADGRLTGEEAHAAVSHLCQHANRCLVSTKELGNTVRPHVLDEQRMLYIANAFSPQGRRHFIVPDRPKENAIASRDPSSKVIGVWVEYAAHVDWAFIAQVAANDSNWRVEVVYDPQMTHDDYSIPASLPKNIHVYTDIHVEKVAYRLTRWSIVLFAYTQSVRYAGDSWRLYEFLAANFPLICMGITCHGKTSRPVNDVFIAADCAAAMTLLTTYFATEPTTEQANREEEATQAKNDWAHVTWADRLRMLRHAANQTAPTSVLMQLSEQEDGQ